MADPYVRTQFKIVAEIGSVKFEDVVAITATFGLNSIPSASLQVASGYEVSTGKVATIQRALSQLKTRERAKVFLTVETNDGRTEKMLPDGTYVIFEGYYSGIGYQRSNTNSVYTIHLLHWLDDLNCSSMLNGNWFQGAPHDMAQAASNFAASQSSGTGISPVPVLDRESELVNKGNMESDLWGKVIKPAFQQIAKFPHPKEQDEAGGSGDPNGIGGATNIAAQNALDRMPGKAPEPATLPLDLSGLNDYVISYSANQGMSRMLTDGLGYNSFWGKLVGELGASFLFGISPGVEFANVIPYFGGLRKEWRTIYGDEYNYASFNANTATLIESVDIFYAQQASTGYSIGGKTPATMNYYRPWGRFPRENRDFRGQILVRDPPGWLSNPVPQGGYSSKTTLPPVGDCHTPQHGPATPPSGIPRPADAEKDVKTSNILDRFCKHWFQSAVLSQRHGELSGKFRLDIAPGSTVKIKAPITAIGEEQDMWGTVTQVSYVINSEQHIAGTSFSLINLRNVKENSDKNLTSAEPPLYPSAGWPGGPLTVKYEPSAPARFPYAFGGGGSGGASAGAGAVDIIG
jgi:hypothetical protein